MGAHGSKEKFGRSASERYVSNSKYIEQERFGRFGKRARGNQFYTNDFLLFFLLEFFFCSFLYCLCGRFVYATGNLPFAFDCEIVWLLFLHFKKFWLIKKEPTTTTTEKKTGMKTTKLKKLEYTCDCAMIGSLCCDFGNSVFFKHLNLEF